MKVIKIGLAASQENIVKRLEELLAQAKAGKLQNIIVAGKTTDGLEVLTGWEGDKAARMELIGHLIAEVCVEGATDSMIEKLEGGEVDI